MKSDQEAGDGHKTRQGAARIVRASSLYRSSLRAPLRKSGTRREDSNGKEARLLAKFCRLFGRMDEDDLGIVLLMTQKMARRKAG
jgi:hypothetical protein